MCVCVCGSATKFLYIARMCVFLYILYSVYCDFHATEHKRVAFFFLFFFFGGGGGCGSATEFL